MNITPFCQSHLILNVLVVLDVVAEVDDWVPHVVLTVQAAAGLFCIFMLRYGNFVPEKRKKRKDQEVLLQNPVMCNTH